METRPGKQAKEESTRGSGPGARKRRSDALGPRKDVIIRMPEGLARQLKIVAACEETTVQDFCLDAIRPQIRETLAKHGIGTV